MLFFFFQAMSIEGQDSIFGQENSVATAQSSSQAQLPEPENKMDDSIDNQQQVCLATGPLPKRKSQSFIPLLYLFTFINGPCNSVLRAVENTVSFLGHGSGRGPRWYGGGDL